MTGGAPQVERSRVRVPWSDGVLGAVARPEDPAFDHGLSSQTLRRWSYEGEGSQVYPFTYFCIASKLK